MTDTHCHLDDARFAGEVEAVVARASAAGVTRMVTIGCDLPTSRKAVEIAEQFPNVWAAVGIHPSDCGRASESELPELERLAAHPRVVGIGECGLDNYRAETSVETQTVWFRRQIALARNAKKPLVIHCRDAFDDLLRILREERAQTIRGVLHCYSGSAEQEADFLSMGFLLAFGGTTTFPKNEKGKAAARAVPPESLVFETDAPYLAPQAFRGRRNEPAYAAETARFVAELRRVDLKELGRITDANADRLFPMAEAPVLK